MSTATDQLALLPDVPASAPSECSACARMREALDVTRGNILSLRECISDGPYEPWLCEVDAALALLPPAPTRMGRSPVLYEIEIRQLRRAAQALLALYDAERLDDGAVAKLRPLISQNNPLVP